MQFIPPEVVFIVALLAVAWDRLFLFFTTVGSISKVSSGTMGEMSLPNAEAIKVGDVRGLWVRRRII
jgi:hypothetical protein